MTKRTATIEDQDTQPNALDSSKPMESAPPLPPPKMPEYEAREHVQALKIKDIGSASLVDPQCLDGGAAALVFEDERFGPVLVSSHFMQTWNPQPGGYWVRRADGQELCLSADDFEGQFVAVG